MPATLPPPTYTFSRTASNPDGFTFTYSMDSAAFTAAKATYESSPEYAVNARTRNGVTIEDRHLARINAAAAYARGATGAGETVVIADSGFYSAHREFSGTGKFTLGASFGDPCTDEEIEDRSCSGPDHGTSSAGVVAARRAPEAGLNMQGVAFDANIIALRVRLGGSGRPVRSTGPPALTDAGDRSNADWYERLLYRPNADGNGYDRNNPWGFVINMSFGVLHGIDSYTRAQVREYRDRTAALFAQAHRAAADRTILVWAAGNQQGRRYAARDGERQGALVASDSPTLTTALGVHFDLPNVLVVVSVDQNGQIAGFSNRCGTAKAFCLAAPGDDIIAPWRGTGETSSMGDTTYAIDSYRSFSGTSAAAPVVTGALAVMRQFFRNPDGSRALGNTELVSRLLATADRTNYEARGLGEPDYSNSDIYGHGLLDLDAATRPVGMLMASTSAGALAPVESTSLDLTQGAFGGQVSRALREVPLALFDQLGSPFFFTADSLVREGGRADQLAASAAATAADRMLLRGGGGGAGGYQRDFNWWFSHRYNSGAALDGFDRRVGLGAFDTPGGEPAFLSPHAFAAPYFSLVRHGFGGGFSAPTAGRGRFGMALMHGAAHLGTGASDDWKRGTAVAFDYRPRAFGRRALHLQFGMVREGEGFLGARPGGAFGAARGETLFAGLGAAWGLGNHWRAQASGYVGHTRPNASKGLLNGVSDLRSSAFSVGLARRSALRRGDWLGLRVSQPMRVESGRAVLRLATARTAYGEVRYRDVDVDLQPRTRAVQAEAAWRAPPGLVGGGDLSLGLQLTRHPGHNPDAATRAFAWLRFQRSF